MYVCKFSAEISDEVVGARDSVLYTSSFPVRELGYLRKILNLSSPSFSRSPNFTYFINYGSHFFRGEGLSFIIHLSSLALASSKNEIDRDFERLTTAISRI